MPIDLPRGELPLVMFPELAHRNLTFAFWSPSFPDFGPFVLTAYDVFKRCPMRHYWPWRAACQKFQWPPESIVAHKLSNTHTKAIANLHCYPSDMLRVQVLQKSRMFMDD